MTNVIMETPIRKRLYQTGKRLGTTPVSCKIVAGISRIIKLKATSNNQNSQRQWCMTPIITTAINTKRATNPIQAFLLTSPSVIVRRSRKTRYFACYRTFFTT